MGSDANFGALLQAIRLRVVAKVATAKFIFLIGAPLDSFG